MTEYIQNYEKRVILLWPSTHTEVSKMFIRLVYLDKSNEKVIGIPGIMGALATRVTSKAN